MSSKKKMPRRRPASASSVSSKKRAAKKTAGAKSRSKTKSGGARATSRASHRSSAGGVPLMLEVVARYGVLRSLLALAGVLLIVFAISPGVVPVYSGWPFVPTVLVPVLAPLILMLLLLDALMSRVLMSDMRGAERDRRRHDPPHAQARKCHLRETIDVNHQVGAIQLLQRRHALLARMQPRVNVVLHHRHLVAPAA